MTVYTLMYSFSNFEPACFSMSGSNCCFLTCIQISQEADQVVWYSHLFKNFPQFVVIHTVKGFSQWSRCKCFSGIPLLFLCPTDVGNLISVSSAFSKSSLYIRKVSVHILLKLVAGIQWVMCLDRGLAHGKGPINVSYYYYLVTEYNNKREGYNKYPTLKCLH